MLGNGLYICSHEFMSVHVGVCVPVDTCVCHCPAVEIMFSVSPSVQEMKQAAVLRASCSIRLGQQIECKHVVVSIRKCQ